MKNNKHVESFGKFNENLRSKTLEETSSSISDVSRSFTIEDLEKAFEAGADMM